VTRDKEQSVAKSNGPAPPPPATKGKPESTRAQQRRLTLAGNLSGPENSSRAADIAKASLSTGAVGNGDVERSGSIDGGDDQNDLKSADVGSAIVENGTASAKGADTPITWTTGTCSIAGYEPMNPFKQNQDIFCILDNFASDPTYAFFGVFDGHGFAGKEASHYVKDKLPATIEKDKHGLKTQTEKALSQAFIKTNKALRSSKVDVTYSGTTAITAFLQGNRLLVCNSGDSRAVLGTVHEGKVEAFDLSDDHKPDRSDEYERIISCKGRVEPVRDLSDETYGPNRVWLRDENLPGLAMSRSFGDAVAHSVGVIPDPEISVKIMDARDKYMVLASDGVYEFMTSKDVIDVVSQYPTPQAAAEALAREAYSRWEAEGEGVADDTTCVVVFFDVKADPSVPPHPIEIRRTSTKR